MNTKITLQIYNKFPFFIKNPCSPLYNNFGGFAATILLQISEFLFLFFLMQMQWLKRQEGKKKRILVLLSLEKNFKNKRKNKTTPFLSNPLQLGFRNPFYHQ